jgi:phenylpyruvate tautomerase PptA (4-oxalocrotonate tautomerase family)
MPLVRISLPAHIDEARARGLADVVHGALVQHMTVPEADRFQYLTRFADADRVVDPHYPSVTRSRDATLIDITLRAGRTDQQKAQLFQSIVAGAAAHGFRSDDIMIVLNETAAGNWSFGHGVQMYGPIASV